MKRLNTPFIYFALNWLCKQQLRFKLLYSAMPWPISEEPSSCVEACIFQQLCLKKNDLNTKAQL